VRQQLKIVGSLEVVDVVRHYRDVVITGSCANQASAFSIGVP